MKTVLAWVGGIAILATLIFFGFNWWTESNRNKTAIEYAQDKWGWFNSTTEDEVVVENEDGTVEATASINF